jgi:hypothetical protein
MCSHGIKHSLQTLNIKEHINVVDTKENYVMCSRMDYGAMLNTFYATFTPGTASQKTHSLSGRHGCITANAMWSSFGGVIRRAGDVEERAGEGRQLPIWKPSTALPTRKAPGICPIKQVELSKKFHPSFVPAPEYWEGNTCPRPRDGVLAQVKDESSKKRKTKVTASNTGPNKTGQHSQKEDAPKVKTSKGVVKVVAAATKGDNDTESDSSE